MSVVDYGVFVRVKEGVEGFIAQNELVLKDEQPYNIGDEIEAEISNLDSQERRLSLSMRIGEVQATATKPAQRESKAPKKGDGESKGSTIGELIKQKLGAQLAADKKDEKKDE